MNQSATPSTSSELYFERISPLVLDTLQHEFPHLLPTEQADIQTLALTACLTAWQNGQKNQPDRAIRQCTRDQVLVWGLAHPSPARQSATYQQVMALYGNVVRVHLQERHRFRTSDVADDILSDTLAVLTRKVAEEVPITNLRSFLLEIAHRKAKKQFDKIKNDPPHTSLDSLFGDVDDDDDDDDEQDDAGDLAEGAWLGPETAEFSQLPDSVDLFLPEPVVPPDEPDSTDPPDPNPEPTENKPPKTRRFRINFRQLQRALADCLGRLTEKRQLLVRLRYIFWKGYEGKLTTEQIERSYDDLGMEEIAQLADYKDARTANSRLTENRQSLRDCLEGKLNLTFPNP